jgi:raffinose/stachyose/melibiose transport system substrate-binding protein
MLHCLSRRIQRSGLIAMLSLFALLLAACGGAAPAANPPAPTAATTNNEPAATAPPTAAAPEPVTLTYVSWMSKGEDKPILAEFMAKYPHITVEDQVLEGGQYDQLLKPRMIGGQAPDVFLFMPGQYGAFVKEGWLMDVTDEPGTQAMKELPPLAESYTIGGKIYGTMVNGNWQSMPIYYNKKYFAEKGFALPTTMEEFAALLEQIKADGVDPIVVGAQDAWTVSIFMLPFQENEVRGRLGAANPDYRLLQGETTVADLYGGSLRFFGDLVQQGYISKASGSLTYDQSVQYFVDGKAALLIQGPWIPGVDQVKTADPARFDLGAFTMPLQTYDGKRHTSASADRSIGISASTAHPEEARLLYNFFLEKANLEQYLSEQSLTTFVPGIEPEVAPALQGYVQELSDPTKFAVYVGSSDKVNVAMPPAWNEALGAVYTNILTGSTAEEELAKLEDIFAKAKDQATVQDQ